MGKYICIDIGGTSIKYGIISEDAAVQSRNEIPTEAEKGGRSILEKVRRLIVELEERPSGICISTAGMVDPAKGLVVYAAPLIPDYSGTNFKETLEAEFGVDCEVENDVNCAGLAEFTSGAARGSQSMVMLTVGTGIGGCAILNGKLLHGSGYSACEIGYLHMRGSDFQSLGAASVLTSKVASWKGEPKSRWSGIRIFSEAKKGDAACIRAIDEMASVLGEGIADVCYILDPEVVVLGGGIMAQGQYLKGRIEASVREYLNENIALHMRLAFARHGNDAGMLGAFYNFKQRH